MYSSRTLGPLVCTSAKVNQETYFDKHGTTINQYTKKCTEGKENALLDQIGLAATRESYRKFQAPETLILILR